MKNEKIIQIVTSFVELMEFMEVKSTGSISGFTSFLWFWKQYTVAGDICKTKKKTMKEL